MQPPVATTSEAIGCLVNELSKLIKSTHTFDGLFKRSLIKCIIGEAGGVVGATPEGISIKCKNDT